jgi:hypothetical protein
MLMFQRRFDLGTSPLGVKFRRISNMCIEFGAAAASTAVPQCLAFSSPFVRLCQESTQERPRTLSLLCRCLTRGFRGLFERLVIELMMCHLGQPLAYSARGTNRVPSSEYSAASVGRLSYNCCRLTVCPLGASLSACGTALAAAVCS